jgi:hypothetical protein
MVGAVLENGRRHTARFSTWQTTPSVNMRFALGMAGVISHRHMNASELRSRPYLFGRSQRTSTGCTFCDQEGIACTRET